MLVRRWDRRWCCFAGGGRRDAQGLEDADGLDDFYPLSWSTLFAGASPLASWTWSRGRLGLGAAWCWDAHDQEF